VFTPHELLERLVALVPRPRAHFTRYHLGVPAPAFAARAQIVPDKNEEGLTTSESASRMMKAGETPRPRRFPWASLIWPVFVKDALECARCAGWMEILARVTSPESIVLIMKHMGYPARRPSARRRHPRPPWQGKLTFDVPGFETDPPAPDDFDAQFRPRVSANHRHAVRRR